MTSVEALIRRRHPVHGLQSPAAFIDVAERIDVLDQIGRWVVRQASRDCTAWGDERREAGIRLSLNVSPRELVSARFIDDVARVLDETGCPGSSLCMEITEGGIIEDPVAAMTTLRRLKELGIVIALDDFGTGFSSLNQLAAFPVDVVKLDRAFVTGLTVGERRRTAVVRAVLSMAEALDMHLVAEGIETDDERRLLMELGVTLGQGYLLGRPAPLDELRQSLRAQDGRRRLAARDELPLSPSARR